jgi:hypothetical protein
VARKAQRTARAAGALADLTDRGPLGDAVAAGLRGLARSLPSFAPPLLVLVGGLPALGMSGAPYGSFLPVIGAALYCVLSGLATARPLNGPVDWLVPPFVRAVEYGTILLLAARADVNGALPAAFGLVAALAYHHYDTVYRIRGNTGAPPAWLVRSIGGHEGRTLLVTVLAAVLAPADFATALTALAVLVALLVLTESIRFWVSQVSSGAPAVHDEGEPA